MRKLVGPEILSTARFRENLDLENMLNNSSPLSNDGKVQNFSIEWECGTCRCNIVYGNSVLLMCGCFNIPQYQICIRFLLAYWVTGGKSKLNEQGIRCVACKNYNPVDNIPAVRKEAKRLVLHGSRVLMGYQQNLLPNADGLHSLLCKYRSMNINGTIK